MYTKKPPNQTKTKLFVMRSIFEKINILYKTTQDLFKMYITMFVVFCHIFDSVYIYITNTMS